MPDAADLRAIVADAERAFAAVRWGGARKWRRAILNQLLLAAASDWPFLVTMGTGRDYAEKRFRDHLARLHELLLHVGVLEGRQRFRARQLAKLIQALPLRGDMLTLERLLLARELAVQRFLLARELLLLAHELLLLLSELLLLARDLPGRLVLRSRRILRGALRGDDACGQSEHARGLLP